MSWNDQEAIESERLDADIQQAELEAAGRSARNRRRQAVLLRAMGKLEEAMTVCSHGWSGYNPDRTAIQCYECGSRMVDQPDGRRIATVPCEFPIPER